MLLEDLEDQAQYLIFAKLGDKKNHIFDCGYLWHGYRVVPVIPVEALCKVDLDWHKNMETSLVTMKPKWEFCHICLQVLENIPKNF